MPYFNKSKGCKVIDLQGNEYIDMSIMGIGTNILGYGHSEVDEAVIKTVQDGNMSTLNCPEEVYLAEKLIKIHILGIWFLINKLLQQDRQLQRLL